MGCLLDAFSRFSVFAWANLWTSVQTRYLRFKGMSYKSERYLCDINCIQLRKALVQFRCGNTQLEAMLGAWKGVPYTERLCRSCDLGKVEDEKHLLLICPNTQKVRERFCSTLPFTHTSILAQLMQTTNMFALAKFVACYQYQRTICSPWTTFCLMDSLVPNGRKIVNSKQYLHEPTFGCVLRALGIFMIMVPCHSVRGRA